MEDINNGSAKRLQTNNANNPAHYTLMVVGIFVTVLGAMLRFAGEWMFIDIISNIIFIVGVVLCLKSVINILK